MDVKAHYEFVRNQLENGITDSAIALHIAKGGTIEFQDSTSHDCVSFELDGKPHREGGPAKISVMTQVDDPKYSVSSIEWFVRGERHREDGPAVVHFDDQGNLKTQMWMIHDRYKDNGDKPNFISAKDQYWLAASGVAHREDGPAALFKSGRKEWWQMGSKHRTDGPAVIQANGKEKYYLNDHLYKTKELFETALLGRAKSSNQKVVFVP